MTLPSERLDISRKWIVVTVDGKRICWGPSKYILANFAKNLEIQFNKGVKVEVMTKKEVFRRKVK